ncbi:hypothetical protein B9Z19DRAFT_1150818 [Tuber borchii]|uniref:HNH nuclease domain-containing protein n=1 Tax=Tuber borchii TaxID=42251 RepID=A0A2T7A923_TUBBO|nr:hypothetical protein B9Z19DRAFT_1150818 [Tuber borchii]
MERNDHNLQEGSYFIATAGTVKVNTEQFMAKLKAIAPGTRNHDFCRDIRARDGCCVISGDTPDDRDMARGYWGALDAAHIYPLRHEDHWTAGNFAQCISILPTSGQSINSVENGLLLRSDIHRHFDNHYVTINPDLCLALILLIPHPLPPPDNRPAIDLLRWHYRQSVLANVRGH